MEPSAHMLFLVGLIVVGGVAYVIAYPFCRKSSLAKVRREAAFEAFFGFFLVSMFAYPTVRGLIDGVAWFASKAATPVAIERAQHPTFYWLLESFGFFVTVIGFAIIATGISKLKSRGPHAL